MVLVIDHRMFPELVEAIFFLHNPDKRALFRIRATCREYRRKAEALLNRRLILRSTELDPRPTLYTMLNDVEIKLGQFELENEDDQRENKADERPAQSNLNTHWITRHSQVVDLSWENQHLLSSVADALCGIPVFRYGFCHSTSTSRLDITYKTRSLIVSHPPNRQQLTTPAPQSWATWRKLAIQRIVVNIHYSNDAMLNVPFELFTAPCVKEVVYIVTHDPDQYPTRDVLNNFARCLSFMGVPSVHKCTVVVQREGKYSSAQYTTPFRKYVVQLLSRQPHNCSTERAEFASVKFHVITYKDYSAAIGPTEFDVERGL